MKLLLDTHALLWMVATPDRLGTRAATALTNAQNQLFVSAASLWEIGIKIGIGKLDLGKRWAQQMERHMARSGMAVLPVELRHCEHMSRLPQHHKDPFDRLIVAQSLIEKLMLVSRDRQFDSYGVKRLW